MQKALVRTTGVSLSSRKNKGVYVDHYLLKRYGESDVKLSVAEAMFFMKEFEGGAKSIKIGDWYFSGSSFKELEPVYKKQL